ncbi:MAG TPA: DNA-binding domain-containing protein [Steroidobacteraceae bacterium]|nr:DNA-binding domain-containing protein [Steroidobacteraceae bacterium]
MSWPPEPARSLRELQAGFAQALREPDRGSPPGSIAAQIEADALTGEARLSLYRNNARAVFSVALEKTYPVVARRVGREFFARLALEYRAAHPSRRGDLHWVGVDFPAWLAVRLAGTGYEWLADLAHLEWACEEALVAAESSAVSVESLVGIPSGQLGEVSLRLAPSLRCVDSPYPIWSVWRENQPDGPGAAVDLALGAQYVAVHCDRGSLLLHSIPERDYRFVRLAASGASLADALEGAALEVEGLRAVLAWLFTQRLVAEVVATSAN